MSAHQTVYGLIRDNGDGGSSMVWLRCEKTVERLLNQDDDEHQEYYANEGSPAMTLTFPADLDLVAAGFHFMNHD